MTTPYIHPDGLTASVIPYLETLPEGYRTKALELFCDAARVHAETQEGRGANLAFMLRWFRQSAILSRSNAALAGDREALAAYNAMELFAGCYREAGKVIASWASRKVRTERGAAN